MKVLFSSVVFILFAMIYGEALPVDEQMFGECQKELGISEGNKDETKLRCLNACVLKKIDFLQPDRNINTNKIKDKIKTAVGMDQAEKFVKITQDCIEEAKSIEDECDFVNAVHQCTDVYKI